MRAYIKHQIAGFGATPPGFGFILDVDPGVPFHYTPGYDGVTPSGGLRNHFTTSPLHHFTTSPLHHSAASACCSTLQHSNTPTRRYGERRYTAPLHPCTPAPPQII